MRGGLRTELGASGFKVNGCGADELIDRCPGLFASPLEIRLVVRVGDVDSPLDGAYPLTVRSQPLALSDRI